MVLIFTHLLLGDKANLSKVWLAAHWERKLKRCHIYRINIESSVQEIMSQEIILDLRLSGHLLVGIVKIFSRKAKYLLHECSDIFNRVRVYHPSLIDLPPNKMQASIRSITLPELFGNIESANSKILDELLTSNQSRIEDITLRETFGNLHMMGEDDFDDFHFREEDAPINFDEDIDMITILNIDKAENGNAIEPIDLNPMDLKKQKPLYSVVHDSEAGLDFNEINGISPAASSSDNDYTKGQENMHNKVERNLHIQHHMSKNSELIFLNDDSSLDIDFVKNSYFSLRISSNTELISLTTAKDAKKVEEKYELNLDPLPGKVKILRQGLKRKRKLIIDEVKKLSKEDVSRQYYNTSDITSLMELAPPTKRAMTLKRTGGCGQLFQLPGQKLYNQRMSCLFQRNLKIYKISTNTFESSNDEEEAYEEIELLRGNIQAEPRNHMSIASCALPENIYQECMDNANGPTSRMSVASCELTEISYQECMDHENDFNGIGGPHENSSDDINNQSDINKKLKEPFCFTEEIQRDISRSQSVMDDSQCLLQERIIRVLKMMRFSFQQSPTIKFSELVKNDRRIKVAQKFLSALTLKKFNVIELHQEKACDEIWISKGTNFIPACNELC